MLALVRRSTDVGGGVLPSGSAGEIASSCRCLKRVLRLPGCMAVGERNIERGAHASQVAAGALKV